LDKGKTIAVVRPDYGVNKSTINFTKTRRKIMGSIQTTALSRTKISYVSHHVPFLKKMLRASCVWLQEDTQDSCHSGTGVRKKTTLVRADLKTVS
jgi:hypothetical protein